MKFCSRTKCWQVTLRFNYHNKFPFFPWNIQLFSDLLSLDTEWPLLSAQIVLIFMLMLQFVTLFLLILVLVIIFSNILPDFSSNIFFYPITFANNLFCLFRPCKQFFFNISHSSHTPLQKNNGSSLREVTSSEFSISSLTIWLWYRRLNLMTQLDCHFSLCRL